MIFVKIPQPPMDETWDFYYQQPPTVEFQNDKTVAFYSIGCFNRAHRFLLHHSTLPRNYNYCS